MHNENNPQAPWLARIPLDPHHQRAAVAIVHPGRAVVPPQGLREVVRFDADGQGGWVSAAQADDGRWGYIDGEGHWRVPPTLQDAGSFSDEGLARFCLEGRWGFVDLAGAVVIAPVFADARPFRNGLSAVLTDDAGRASWRIIDREGRFTCPGFFHDISEFGANGLACATQWNQSSNQRLQGFVNSTGQWVIEPCFQRVLPFGDAPVAAASLDGELFGLINARGQWVLEPRYPRIDAFNAQGLAYFDEPNVPDNGHGYLDARGTVVVTGGRNLSPFMACGVAANCCAGTSYLNAQGQAVAGPRLSFGSHFFPQGGFAVVRTAAASSGGPAPAQDVPPGAWGLLHPDGRWVPAPDHLLEPLTDRDGWLVGPQTGTPLVPFLTRDGQLAFIDGEGTVAWRAHYDGQQAALLDASGEPLWRSAVREDCWPPRPFFNTPASDYLQGGLITLDGIVLMAARLLADAEIRLHQLAEGQTLAPDECGNSDGDEDKDADPEQVQVRRTVVVRRILRAYLSGSHNGPYKFLCTERNQVVDTTRAALQQRLSARFGTPEPNPGHAAPGHERGDCTQAWLVALARPLPGDSGALHEPREQWLTLHQQSNAGEGGAWWELWLMAAPSVDALQLAQRARRQASAAHGRNGFAASARQPIPQTSREDAIEPDAGRVDRYALPRDEAHDRSHSHRAGRNARHGASGRLVLQSTLHRHASATSKLKLKDSDKGVMAAGMVQTALGARSQTPPTLQGRGGWLRQRPMVALALHWLLGLTALAAHVGVSVGAWRAEGPWVGLGTFALMGFADLYWAWRFAWASPASPGLAVGALVVVAYVFGWRWLYGRAGRAFAAQERRGNAVR